MTAIFGIDLGTTNSLIAKIGDGEPRVIEDPISGETLLPSVVAIFENGELHAGAEAIAGESSGQVVVRSIKRYMGLGSDDVTEVDRRHFEFAQNSGPIVRFAVGARSYTPPEISAEILRALKRRGEAALREKVERVVITVPAYFNDAQRQATRDAGRLAGLEVVRLLNEPTAASLAYGLQKKVEGRVAVYDFGGGTFDISILSIKGGIFEVLATHGDTHLGGDDIDRAGVDWLLAEAPEELRNERAVWNQARAAIEQAKHRLSDGAETTVTLELGRDRVVRELTRAQLEAFAAPFIARTLESCRRAMADGGLEAAAIDSVVLVGGSTRMPLVRHRVAEFFGREPLCSLNPDEVVALGAAVQASVLMGAQNDLLLLDVVPLSLGIESMGGVLERLIHRNSTIPTSATEMFTTAVDNQTHVDIHVVQGERELAQDCRSLARFKLGPLEPQPAGLPRVQVTFLVDANGILNVTACDQRTGREHSVDIKPSYGLTDDDIERMLEESIDLGEADLELRLLIIARSDAAQMMTALRKQLKEYPELIDSAERERVMKATEDLERVANMDDRELIAKLTDELNRLSTPFAERIMDRALSEAVQRRTLEQLT